MKSSNNYRCTSIDLTLLKASTSWVKCDISNAKRRYKGNTNTIGNTVGQVQKSSKMALKKFS